MARRKLPSLRALLAFEAAGRLGSFRQAADEMGLTRSAVSHQIKGLETSLGVKLFNRETRRAELTVAGAGFLPGVREAFDIIEAQSQALKPQSDNNELTIQVYVTVALKWLIPRLHDFERRFPDMKVRLSTSSFKWDFDEDNVDAGFVLARNRMAGHAYRPLLRSRLTPVCAPSLLNGPDAIRTFEDLRAHRLLYVYTAEEDWRTWLEAAGLDDIQLSQNLAFDSYVTAQEAAIEGRGLVMTIGPFHNDDERDGRLVRPFDLIVDSPHSWDFVCKATDRLKPKIRRFENWLAAQVEQQGDTDIYRRIDPGMPGRT